MRATLTALAYVEVRSQLARLRRLIRSPIFLLLIAGFMWAAIFFDSGADMGDGFGDISDLGYVAALAVVLMFTSRSAATRSCPIRLRGPDLAWLIPGGRSSRPLVAWYILDMSARILVLGTGAGLIIAATGGRPMWRPVLALAAAVAFIRAVPSLTHLLAIKGKRRTIGLVVPLTWLGVAVSAGAQALERGGLPELLHTVVAPARAILEALVAGVTAPTDPSGLLVVAVLATGAVVAATIALGTGYEEGAAKRTWEFEAATASVRDGSVTGEAMAEAISRRVRHGVPSLDRGFGMRGEWALVWRALAAWRRSWRGIVLTMVVSAVTTTLLVLIAPTAALIPAGLLAAAAIIFTQSGMVEESAHLALYRISGSPMRKVIAVDVVPIAVTVNTLLVAAAPWLATRHAGEIDLAALMVGPIVVAAVISIGGTASLWARTIARQIALAGAGGLVAIGVVVTLGSATEALGWGLWVGVAGASTLIAAGAWVTSARLISRGSPG